MRIDRPTGCNRQRLVAGLLTIALTTVITTLVQAAPSQEEIKSPETSQQALAQAKQELQQQVLSSTDSNNKKSSQHELQQQSTVIEISNNNPQVVADTIATVDISKPGVVRSGEPEKAAAAAAPEADSNSSELNGKRKGRAEVAAAPAASDEASPGSEANKETAIKSTVDQKVASNTSSATQSEATKTKQESSKSSSSSPGAGAAAAAASAPNKTAKQPTKSSTKSKLPANLGTVTSTGSGSAHYMSKHDAYSAIAEKHGALAHNSMRKSSSDRHRGGVGGYQGFGGGIQKASGLGDMFSPFKGVTDSGLARTLGASMRSIIKGKYSVPAYVASALLGAVALMAFYESPISPLPVPPLPEPPVGRFPPEMPNISPNTQVPFRVNQQQQYNQQQNYNQRSLNTNANTMMPQVNNLAYTVGMTATGQQQPMQQQQQQVLFPGSMQQAQQRQMSASGGGGPIQQMAASLLSTVAGGAAKQQNAQRKSGIDYDLPPSASARSFFGSSIHQQHQPMGQNNNRMSSSAQAQKSSTGSSLLSFFGLGSASSAPSAPLSQAQSLVGDSSQLQSNIVGVNQMSPLQGASGSLSSATNSFVEPKGNNQASSMSSVLSNSHLVNKVKSFFSRSGVSPMGGSSSASGVSNSNPYDQYQKMSFVQAFMKDTAFLPAFLSPTRKSSQASPPNGNKLQATISNVLQQAGSSASSQPSAASRMSHSSDNNILTSSTTNTNNNNSKSSPSPPSGYGVVRAADRIAHALLETFTSGLARNAQPAASYASQQQSSSLALDSAGRKSANDNNNESQSLAMATTSLLSDIMSSYGSSSSSSQQPQLNEQAQQQQQQPSQPEQSQQQGNADQKSAASARSIDGGSSSSNTNLDNNEHTHKLGEVLPVASSANNKQQSQSSDNSPPTASANSVQSTSQQSNSNNHQSQPATLNRKTRSVGFDYPIESNQELAQRESQHPSKATQINNVIDYVTDSYSQNRLLFNFVMNQFGFSQAVPYVEQILTTGNDRQH